MENKVINQKEYLKKYMSFGDTDVKKKKKKRKHKVGAKTVKVIDDDIDLKNMRPIKEGEIDILIEGEDAPQIAGIVDERGPVNFLDKRRWKIITENEEGDLTITNRVTDMAERDVEANVKRNKKNDNVDVTLSKSKHSKNKRLNLSLRSRANDSDSSPPRLSNNYDSDLSPPRQSKNYDSDLSPPRQSRNDDSDLSPPRQARLNNLDSSPPRKSRNYDSNLSPSRRDTKHRNSARGTSGRSYRSSGNREDSDSDFSPPRKRKQNLDADLYESRRNIRKGDGADLDVSRRKERRSRKDNSPRSNVHKVTERGHDHSNKDSSNRHHDASRSSDHKRSREHDERKSYSKTNVKRKRSRWEDIETDDLEHGRAERSKDRDGRMTKTLDGKTAGLQDAKALREETEAHKQREMEQFSKLSKAVSGVGQAPIMRDRTGRRRDLEAEAAEDRERETQQREIDEQYMKWGRGLKQMEDREEKLKSDLREMSKPLARYADDEDLDKELREQEREGDPMLEYIKKKQIKDGKRKSESQKYKGSYAPNRFGIKPGYRWDGVDRSNGYEKKWFKSQNTKVARQEEAYKWSTADM